MITHFAVGMPVETFKSKKKVCISLKFIILKIKDPWLILINCQTCHFNFFIEWTQFFFFIGPESDYCLPLSLTHSCLVNLISVTLACGDGNSKLVEVVTVVEVGHKVKFLFGL